MKKPFKLAAISATAALIVSAPYASAATGHADAQPAVTHVKTVAAFDFATGDVPENITVAPDNSLTVSMVGTPAGERPALVRIAPSGHRTVLVTGQKGDGITGNTRGHDGTVYYNVWSSDASRNGVWKLPLGGTPHRIAALPAGGVPNGLAINPAGRTTVIGDGGYRGTGLVIPHRRERGQAELPAWKDEHDASHRKVRARVEHVFARMKNWKILRDCRLKGDGVYHAMLGIARLHNLALAE